MKVLEYRIMVNYLEPLEAGALKFYCFDATHDLQVGDHIIFIETKLPRLPGESDFSRYKDTGKKVRMVVTHVMRGFFGIAADFDGCSLELAQGPA